MNDFEIVEIKDHIVKELAETEQKKVTKLKTTYRRKEFLSGRKAIVNALKNNLGPIKEVEISIGKVNCDKGEFYCSISHDKNIAVGVVSDAPIGIDTEADRKVSELVIKKFFSDEELESFDPLTLWTIKEATSKLLRKGISADFSKIKVSLKDGKVVSSYREKHFEIDTKTHKKNIISVARSKLETEN